MKDSGFASDDLPKMEVKYFIQNTIYRDVPSIYFDDIFLPYRNIAHMSAKALGTKETINSDENDVHFPDWSRSQLIFHFLRSGKNKI